MIIHGGLVMKRINQVWRGALIEGESGSGKSDLMLRLLDLGFRLVADDRVVLWRSDGVLYGRAPDPLRGLIEAVAAVARGHGAPIVSWFTMPDNKRAHAVYDRLGGSAETLLEYELEL